MRIHFLRKRDSKACPTTRGRIPNRLALPILCLFLAFPWTAQSQTLSVRQEAILGERFRADIVLKNRLLQGTVYNSIVDRAMRSLLATDIVRQRNLPYRWEWFVVDAPNTVNAGAGPGGKFVIYSGLAKVLGEEESLWAAILAHEVGHALYRHSIRAIERNASRQRLLNLLGRANSTGAAIAGATGTFGIHLLNLKLSRDDESQADELGLLLMAQAGYHPDFGFAMQEAMRRKFGDSSRLRAFFSDHPRWVTREERTYDVYIQARSFHLSAVEAGRAKGGNPPSWATIEKPIVQAGIGPAAGGALAGAPGLGGGIPAGVSVEGRCNSWSGRCWNNCGRPASHSVRISSEGRSKYY